MASFGDYLRLVKFSHSVFALPFALMGAWLAAGGLPEWRLLGWIVLCAVSARTSAMAFNRWVDRDVDALNPRTATREIPAGVLTPNAVLGLTIAAGLLFCWAAYQINPLCGKLSPAVLLVLLGYSLAKRFTFLAHAVLGVALGLAPLGAWIAVRGSLEGLQVPFVLALSVLCWVSGFDLIYACQDEEFDRGAGLHSVPARFGRGATLWAARCLHLLAALAWIAVGGLAGLGFAYFMAVGLAIALLVHEHRLVSPQDLSRVNMAFFTMNGWISVGLFVGTCLDFALA